MNDNSKPIHPRVREKMEYIEKISALEYRKDTLREELQLLEAEIIGLDAELNEAQAQFFNSFAHIQYQPASSPEVSVRIPSHSGPPRPNSAPHLKMPSISNQKANPQISALTRHIQSQLNDCESLSKFPLNKKLVENAEKRKESI